MIKLIDVITPEELKSYTDFKASEELIMTTYIHSLPLNLKEAIAHELRYLFAQGVREHQYSYEDAEYFFDNAMNGRISDLEDTIDIHTILEEVGQ